MSAPTSTIAGPATACRSRAVPVVPLLGWGFVGLATTIAFGRTWRAMGPPVDPVFGGALLVLAGVVALGIAVRRAPWVPRDRGLDVALGLTGLIVAAGLLGLLTVRLGEQYLPLRLDLAAALVFVISSAVLVFGWRQAARYWPVWVLLLGLLPPVYEGGVALLGGGDMAAGRLLVVFAGFAVGVLIRRVTAVAVTALIGAVSLIAVEKWLPPFGRFIDRRGVRGGYRRGSRDSCGAGADEGHGSAPRPWAVRSTPLGVDRSRHRAGEATLSTGAGGEVAGVGVVVIVAAALAWIPLPGGDVAVPATVAGVVVGEEVGAPGWNLVDGDEHVWKPRSFGPDAVGSRRILEAGEVDLDWDVAGRKRRVAVDVVRVASGERVGGYPDFAQYRLAAPRLGPLSYFELGAGVVGRMRTVVEDGTPLRWTWLSWDWQGAGGVERVTLIAAVDHRAGAAFPEPDGSPTALSAAILRQALRGRPVDGGPAVLADTDLLLTLAHLLVAVRTGAR
ncbi:hypothetical protein [Nocardia asteroides]|uniref:Uncharacterized protein n=1 Tax=Nocardia asteroides NBRC 15531 TaxID=1110697 RepID=U5EF60_NOCAS|nr:hypothetical protein [Nocardia asteroides]UGT46599.1 hypothetical protein LT345_18780 [Nocardia asteroides]GAD85043.1 hypothetical protein NCAST_26_00200 [Nocardia asteroides NBRC 15531]SFN51508.1 hypothetical protein SAMN05444423_11021 [Nocardia asteroides]VEG34565.1 Uncharacterised protein [Nocardia asteroides]